MAGAKVCAGVRLGPATLVSYNGFVGHGSTLGTSVSVMPNASVCGDVIVGDLSLVGANGCVLEERVLAARSVVPAGSTFRSANSE